MADKEVRQRYHIPDTIEEKRIKLLEVVVENINHARLLGNPSALVQSIGGHVIKDMIDCDQETAVNTILKSAPYAAEILGHVLKID